MVILCRGGGMVDALDSKSSIRKGVRVRVSPSAPFFPVSDSESKRREYGSHSQRLRWKLAQHPPQGHARPGQTAECRQAARVRRFLSEAVSQGPLQHG